MFTIKYRTYNPAPPVDGMINSGWLQHEQIWGPFEFVTQEAADDGKSIIYGHYKAIPGETGGLPMTFGPIGDDWPQNQPRPMLWVMNEQGATIAKYDL